MNGRHDQPQLPCRKSGGRPVGSGSHFILHTSARSAPPIFDHQPDNSPRRGPGLPTPPNGSRAVSSIRRSNRLASFGLVCTRNCRSSKACGLNSKRILQVFHGFENAVLGVRDRHGFPQPRHILGRPHQAIRGITRHTPLGTERLAQDEFLDRHAGKRRQCLDLPVLLRLDFNRQSVHAVKIVNFYNFVRLGSPDTITPASPRHPIPAMASPMPGMERSDMDRSEATCPAGVRPAGSIKTRTP
jgi:hypothetical protein